MGKITFARGFNAVVVGALILAALALNLQYNPTSRRLRADPSIMLYVGQQILRGNPPYTSVTIVKTPVTGMLVAGALGAARLRGYDDILAARAAFMLLAALVVAVTFLSGAALWSRWAGFFAALALLGMDVLFQRAADGPSPKIPFILFGIAALWLGARRRWLLAGAAGMLSFLTWQPGLVFVAAVALGAWLSGPGIQMDAPDSFKSSTALPRAAEFNRPGQRWGNWRALALALGGAAVPLVLVALYLGATGALADGIKQTLGANLSYFGASKLGGGLTTVMRENLVNVTDEAPRCLSGEELWVPLGLLGLVGMGGVALWQARRGRRDELGKVAPLWFTFAVLVGFTLIDFQSCADLLPFFPYLALGIGWLGWALLRVIEIRTASPRRPTWLNYVLGAVVAALVLGYGLADLGTERRGQGLADQRKMAASIGQQLGHARLQQFGDAVLLVLLHRENATRFIHLGNKQGAGILRAEGVDPAQLPVLLEQAQPGVISLSRAKDQPWAQPLYDWIETHYRLKQSYDAANGGTPQQTDIYVLK